MQRHLRLRRREDFAQLRENGRVWRHRLLWLSIGTNTLPHNRYGFVTSKQLGKAVVRNRTRRLLREAVRHAHPFLVPGYDMVFIARPRLAGQPFQAVCEAVEGVLHQADLWAAPPGEPPA
jgi:ribonuclease P protein component